MTHMYTAKLALIIQKTDVSAQKIYSLALVTYDIVIAGFLLQEKLKTIQFLEENYLLVVTTSMKIVLKILFTIFSI